MFEHMNSDFTESNYKKIIRLAKEQYTFVEYSKYKTDGKNLFWRHDIDFSVHRAYALARVEMEYGVSSTFFINIHNCYYNVFETEISLIIKKILEMGHHLGLHLDASYYGDSDLSSVERNIVFEKQILEKVYATDINVFSFHNPTSIDLTKMRDEIIGDMVNTYSDYFINNCNYCSDSNGYWRFDRLEDVIRDAKYEKLQVLTHPEWWTPEPMSPRERITRCIEGRAKRNHLLYDELMDKFGRMNIK